MALLFVENDKDSRPTGQVVKDAWVKVIKKYGPHVYLLLKPKDSLYVFGNQCLGLWNEKLWEETTGN